MARKKKVVEEVEKEQDLIFSDIPSLTEDEKNKIGGDISDIVNDALGCNEMKRRNEMIDLSWDAYEQKAPPRTSPWPNAPKVRIDLEGTICDGYVARQLAGNFDVDPFVHVEGWEKGDIEKAPLIETFLQWWHTKKINLYGVAENGFLRKAVEGHQVTKTVWERDIDSNPRYMEYAEFRKGNDIEWVGRGEQDRVLILAERGYKMTGKTESRLEERTRTVFEGPKIVLLNGKDYIFPIKDTLPEETPKWEAHRIWLSNDDILERIEKGIYFKSASKVFEKDGGEQGSSIVPKAPPALNNSNDKPSGDKCVIQWFGKYKREKDKYAKTYLFTIHLDSKTLLRAQYNPYWHGKSIFNHNRLFVSRDFWGFGIPHAIRHLSWACSEIVNQTLETSWLRNSLNFKYKEGSFDPSVVAFQIGKGIPVKNMADIEAMNIGATSYIDMTLMSAIREMAQSRVGYGRFQSGMSDPKQKTARGVIALLRESALTFDKVIRSDQNWLEEVSSQEIQLFQQFLPYPGIQFKKVGQSVDKLLEMPGMANKLFKVSPDDVTGNYNYIPMGSSHIAVRELDMQINMMLYNLLMKNPIINLFPESQYKLTDDVIKSSGKKAPILPTMNEYVSRVTGGINNDLKITPELIEAARNKLMEQGASEEEIQPIISQLEQRMAQQSSGKALSMPAASSTPATAVEGSDLDMPMD